MRNEIIAAGSLIQIISQSRQNALKFYMRVKAILLDIKGRMPC